MNVSKITDYLYVSTRLRGEDVEAIRKLNIRLIIGMIASRPPSRRLGELNIEVLWLGTFDFVLFPIPLGTLYRGVKAALLVIREGHPVLVYCQAGRHRSVAMASAILVGMGYTAQDAMDLIVQKRPVAHPQAYHIQRQIRRFEKYWHRRQEQQGKGDDQEPASNH